MNGRGHVAKATDACSKAGISFDDAIQFFHKEIHDGFRPERLKAVFDFCICLIIPPAMTDSNIDDVYVRQRSLKHHCAELGALIGEFRQISIRRHLFAWYENRNVGHLALPRDLENDVTATRQLAGHRRIQMDAFRKMFRAEVNRGPHLRDPSMFREPLQCDSLHPIRNEAHFDKRRRADCTRHQMFVLTDGRCAVKAAIEIAVPVADVLLPAREIATAFPAILISMKYIEIVDRMHGEVDRASGVQGLEALRGMEPAH